MTFTPTDTADYTDDSFEVLINVAQAPTYITWSNPADIVHGTALSGAQLDATATVGGTFTYVPAAGTVLGVGNGQILAVDFTPTDATDYLGGVSTVTINVLPTPPPGLAVQRPLAQRPPAAQGRRRDRRPRDERAQGGPYVLLRESSTGTTVPSRAAKLTKAGAHGYKVDAPTSTGCRGPTWRVLRSPTVSAIA